MYILHKKKLDPCFWVLMKQNDGVSTHKTIKKERNSPLNGGSCCNSTSCELRYLDEPCDFLLFFLSERLANGSIRSTNVPDDITINNRNRCL